MPSIRVFKRKGKDGKPAETYTAQIKFGRRAQFLRSTGAKTEREALAIAKRLAKEIEENELPRQGREIYTLDTMFGRYWTERASEQRSSATTAFRVQNILKTLGGERVVEDLTDAAINEFVQARKRDGVTGATINRELTVLQTAIRYSKRWGVRLPEIEWGDHDQGEAAERSVTISPEEARRLAEVLSPHRHICLAFLWSIYTGCRRNETQTLVWERVHLRDMRVSVWAKGGKYRNVWLSDKALAILDEARAGRDRPTGNVFDLTNRRRIWEAARKEIGRDDLHWHDLRACCATWLRQHNRSDLKLIARILGHANISTTDRYAHVVDDEALEALNGLRDIGVSALLTAAREHGAARDVVSNVVSTEE